MKHEKEPLPFLSKEDKSKTFSLKKKKYSRSFVLGSALAAAGVFLAGCKEAQTDYFSSPTPVEKTAALTPFFDFPPPSEKLSCPQTMQYIYSHFDDKGYLFVDEGKYVVFAPSSFSGSTNLGVYLLDQNIKEEQFKNVEVPMLRERLSLWFEKAGIDLDETQIFVSIGTFVEDPYHNQEKKLIQVEGAPWAYIGSEKEGCLRFSEK